MLRNGWDVTTWTFENIIYQRSLMMQLPLYLYSPHIFPSCLAINPILLHITLRIILDLPILLFDIKRPCLSRPDVLCWWLVGAQRAPMQLQPWPVRVSALWCWRRMYFPGPLSSTSLQI